MSVITLRGLAPEVEKRVRVRANREGKSLNRLLGDLVEEGVMGRAEKRPREHHDLDDLIGSWVPDSECDKALEEMDRIDPELWK